MPHFDMLDTVDVGDGTSDTQYPIVDSCREMESLSRRYGDLSSFVRDFGEVVDVDVRHFGIAVYSGSCKSFFLDESYLFHDMAKFFR
jgi:hypothetical protein